MGVGTVTKESAVDERAEAEGDRRESTPFPFTPLVSRNGVLLDPAVACINVQNPAVTSAFGVYETLQVVQGHIFRLQDHLKRLQHSAAAIGLALPANLDHLACWALDLVNVPPRRDATLRILALNGDPFAPAAVYMLLLEPVRHPRALYKQGASAVTFEGERALPTAKTLNTLVNFLARRAAQAAGCQEGLLVARDGIREGASSNIFAVINGALVTPPDHLVLSGVTRDIVLGLARERGLRLVYRTLAVESIPRWQEAFLTSTSRHVMPLTRIDGRPINGGEVGPVTRMLMEAFEEYFWQEVGKR